MRCSRCSEIIKPIVAVDIDGTLGDYHGTFMSFAREWLGRGTWIDFSRPTRVPEKYDAHLWQFGDWVSAYFGIDKAIYRQIKLAYRQGAQKRIMPIFTGAQALCWSIRDAGAELWITTTRPYLSLDNVVPDTVAWLKRHDIEYDGMLFDDDKYSKLHERVDPDCVVAIFDDIPELVDAANNFFPGRGWLVRGAWNQGVRRPNMCDLDSAADLAKNAITTWKGTYDERLS